MPIVITIDTDGSTTIAVNGVAGRKCKDLTANLEKALGKTISDTPTKDMIITEKVTVKQ